MILLKIRELIFNPNIEKSWRYNQIGTELCCDAPFRLKGIITESVDSARLILKAEIMNYIREYLEENGIKETYEDFKYQIHYSKPENSKIDLSCWQWDGKTYDFLEE